MSIKRIKFAEYVSPPLTICEIQSLCNTPQKYNDLISKYSKEDVDKLIQQKFLIKTPDDFYINDLVNLKLPQQTMEVKHCHNKVFYLLHLKSQILQFCQ